MLTLQLAVGAGLEPAHASLARASPPTRCDTIPLILPTKQTGGDDPIRTDGAFRGHSALAVRCLRPLGHVSTNLWWGWRDLNSHARRHWFLRPACLPFPPHPHDLLTCISSDTHQAIGFLSTNPSTKDWWAPRDLDPEGVTALQAAASTDSARSPQSKSPSISRGALAVLRNFA